MKKRYGLFGLLVLMCLLLAACGCKHEWKEADCENPKICTLCGETEGEKLEHQWKDATCESPKTCTLCQKTEGEALGHLYPPVETSCEEPLTCDRCGKPEREARPHTWKDATCTEPRSCMSCWMTEGEPLGHSWQEATSKDPKTCRVCGLTDGEKIQVDARFETDRCKFLFGSWRTEVTEVLQAGGQVYEIAYWGYYEFHNDGTGVMYMEVDDREAFLYLYTEAMMAVMYDTLAQQGISKSQADQVFWDEHGMTIQEYCYEISVQVLDMMRKPQQFVYYVMGGKIYFGETWKGEFTPVAYDKVGEEIHLDDGEILTPVN